MDDRYMVRPIPSEIARIRELSKSHRHLEALAAAEALLVKAPGDRDAMYLVAANQRSLSRIAEALAVLLRLEKAHPRFSLLYQERGYCYTSLRKNSAAIDAFVCAVKLNPALIASWKMLVQLYRISGQPKRAEAAAERLSSLQDLPPEVVRAGSLFSDGDLTAAEDILRAYLQKDGDDVEALRLLGRIQHQHGVLDEAAMSFERVLSNSPDYLAARLDYVRVLLDAQKYLAARKEIEALLRIEDDNLQYLSLHAAILVGLGEYEDAIAAYRRQLILSPASAEAHVALGHVLKTVGRREEAIRAYRTAADIRPGFGDAWWSLANLKTYQFAQDEVARMRTGEASATDPVDRYHLCFALGKAYEDGGAFSESWLYYERGNRLKRAEASYNPEIAEANTRKQIETCTSCFFTERRAAGAQHPDPIFIVGLPRSGSTLIEQILASHSQVDGTQELPNLPQIVSELQGYPESLKEMPLSTFASLGERYLSETRIYRQGRPFFTDKMPNNFHHIGLIHLILPNAKIIDARREPMACCFSNFKQLFAKGQEFTYSLEDIARYYRTYRDLMQHWDAVLPARVLRVRYEDVVRDLAKSVSRILDFCGLRFERACLEFYKTKRSVYTPSSEQVRNSISDEGLQQWRNYEPWLSILKTL